MYQFLVGIRLSKNQFSWHWYKDTKQAIYFRTILPQFGKSTRIALFLVKAYQMFLYLDKHVNYGLTFHHSQFCTG